MADMAVESNCIVPNLIIFTVALDLSLAVQEVDFQFSYSNRPSSASGGDLSLLRTARKAPPLTYFFISFDLV
jgi:hypothetical protein